MPETPPIPQYSLTAQGAVTINSLVSGLSARLGVPTNPYWVTAELQAYVIEALRTWNAMTKHWRTRLPLTATPGTFFYDLSNPVITNPVLIPYTVRDVDLIPTIQYHFLEPANPTAWTGSEMFTLADLTNAMQRRRDQFLLETGCVIQQYSFPLTASPVGRFLLSEAVIDVRRCAFQTTAGKYFQMSGADEIELASFLPFWDRSATQQPKAWSVTMTPPFQIQVAPAPKVIGTLQMLVVAVGAVLNPATGVEIGVPDDFSWVIKWGAMADLLGKDSPARDLARAVYCEDRYQQGAELARRSSTVLNGTVNNRQVKVESVYDLDYHSPNWHNTFGAPNRIAMAGMNMLAVNRVPDTQYGITLDVVQNAPVSSLSADLGLSPAAADALIDYAEHLAAFKMGGAEFQATQPQYERMLKMAGVEDERDEATSKFADSLKDRETREETQRWRRRPVNLSS